MKITPTQTSVFVSWIHHVTVQMEGFSSVLLLNCERADVNIKT